jgi:hypothetical protein
MIKKMSRDEVLEQTQLARAAGRRAQREPWWPVAVRYERGTDAVVITLRAGAILTIPRADIKALKRGDVKQLAHVKLAGEAIRWESLDVDVSVPGLIGELLGARLSTRESGRAGGRSKSQAKAAAARRNGAKGGRPRGT